jgi:hypothetical protein
VVLKETVVPKAGKGKKAEGLEVEIINSNAELVKVPKPKKVKPWVRDAINITAVRNIEDDNPGAMNKYSVMLKSISNQ